MNVANMLRIVASISDAMILESLLPDLHIRAKFLLRAKGKATLDELNRLLQACQRSHQDMDVVGHNGEFVQKIGGASVVIESVNQKLCPRISLKKRTTSPSFGRDHIGLAGIGRVFSLWSHVVTPRAKAPLLILLPTARLKARPFKTKS